MSDRMLSLLARLGYGPERVRPNFRVLAPDGVLVTDAVGFARPNGPFDSSTATVVAQWLSGGPSVTGAASQRGIRAAWALGAPVMVGASDSGIVVFAVTEQGRGSVVQQYAWESDLSALRDSIAPRALLEAKLGHRQLALFPAAARLFARAREHQAQALAPLLTRALSAAEEVLLDVDDIKERSAAEAHSRAARLVVGALTAVVLRDKEDIRLTPGLPDAARLDVALQRYPSQFSWLGSLTTSESQVFDVLLELLGDTDYSAVDPSLLSGLYETQLVASARRRALGMHYTPLGLARRLVAWMPFEEIDPDLREVYDPTCGSGTLLLAAHDRLRDLQPAYWPLAQSHADLRRRLHGADQDPIAVGIASLSLLLHASPAGNGWDIQERDALTEAGPRNVPITVANPPWSYGNEDGQDDLAQKLLSRMLLSLPDRGLLGVVLPDGWLSRASRGARRSRDAVAERCDVMEVWRLPSGTFPGARMGAAVVIARARRPRVGGTPSITLLRRVTSSQGLSRFYERGEAHARIVAGDGNAWATGPLHVWWQSREASTSTPTVGSYATIRSGPQPESRAIRLQRYWLARKEDMPLGEGRIVPFVVWAQVRQFGEAGLAEAETLRFPDEMQNASSRGGDMIGRRKVLVSGSRDPRQAWRLKVAVDTSGALAVKNTVKAILPRLDEGGFVTVHGETLTEEGATYALSALLGSGFASAWLDEENLTREIRATSISGIPAPPPPVMRDLEALGRDLARAVAEGRNLASLTQALEDLVWDWLSPPRGILEEVVSRLSESPAPEGHHRYARPAPPGAVEPTEVSWERSGVVVGVDNQRIRVVIPGRTSEGGTTIDLPPRMPGALLAAGKPFVVLDDGGDLRRLAYSFHETAWQTDEEIDDQFLSLLMEGNGSDASV